MSKWIRTFATSGGDPQECGTSTETPMFIIVYTRVGGNDDVVPRRVVGMGVSRVLAHADAKEALGRYDRSWQVVSSR